MFGNDALKRALSAVEVRDSSNEVREVRQKVDRAAVKPEPKAPDSVPSRVEAMLQDLDDSNYRTKLKEVRKFLVDEAIVTSPSELGQVKAALKRATSGLSDGEKSTAETLIKTIGDQLQAKYEIVAELVIAHGSDKTKFDELMRFVKIIANPKSTTKDERGKAMKKRSDGLTVKAYVSIQQHMERFIAKDETRQRAKAATKAAGKKPDSKPVDKGDVDKAKSEHPSPKEISDGARKIKEIKEADEGKYKLLIKILVKIHRSAIRKRKLSSDLAQAKKELGLSGWRRKEDIGELLRQARVNPKTGKPLSTKNDRSTSRPTSSRDSADKKTDAGSDKTADAGRDQMRRTDRLRGVLVGAYKEKTDQFEKDAIGILADLSRAKDRRRMPAYAELSYAEGLDMLIKVADEIGTSTLPLISFVPGIKRPDDSGKKAGGKVEPATVSIKPPKKERTLDQEREALGELRDYLRDFQIIVSSEEYAKLDHRDRIESLEEARKRLAIQVKRNVEQRDEFKWWEKKEFDQAFEVVNRRINEEQLYYELTYDFADTYEEVSSPDFAREVVAKIDTLFQMLDLPRNDARTNRLRVFASQMLSVIVDAMVDGKIKDVAKVNGFQEIDKSKLKRIIDVEQTDEAPGARMVCKIFKEDQGGHIERALQAYYKIAGIKPETNKPSISPELSDTYGEFLAALEGEPLQASFERLLVALSKEYFSPTYNGMKQDVLSELPAIKDVEELKRYLQTDPEAKFLIEEDLSEK